MRVGEGVAPPRERDAAGEDESVRDGTGDADGSSERDAVDVTEALPHGCALRDKREREPHEDMEALASADAEDTDDAEGERVGGSGVDDAADGEGRAEASGSGPHAITLPSFEPK